MKCPCHSILIAGILTSVTLELIVLVQLSLTLSFYRVFKYANMPITLARLFLLKAGTTSYLSLQLQVQEFKVC